MHILLIFRLGLCGKVVALLLLGNLLPRTERKKTPWSWSIWAASQRHLRISSQFDGYLSVHPCNSNFEAFTHRPDIYIRWCTLLVGLSKCVNKETTFAIQRASVWPNQQRLELPLHWDVSTILIFSFMDPSDSTYHPSHIRSLPWVKADVNGPRNVNKRRRFFHLRIDFWLSYLWRIRGDEKANR